MNVYVSIEHRFSRTPDGVHWTSGTYACSFWERYLAVFDSVTVLARVAEVETAPPGNHAVSMDRVAFAALPYYRGPLHLLLRIPAILNSLRAAVRQDSCYILRLPSAMGCLLAGFLYLRGIPYVVDVIGDPSDGLAPGTVRHWLRPLLRCLLVAWTRSVVHHAAVAGYVTGAALQRRYPCTGRSYAVSDVELPMEAFSMRRFLSEGAGPFRLVTVGSLDHSSKGYDVLLRAMALCAGRGLHLHADFVGGGRERPALETLRDSLGLPEAVTFHGHYTEPRSIRRVLDGANLFVLPSRQEGLPRALLEAMARGLPCLASSIGGIPELLPGEWLVPPNDPVALADKLCAVCSETQNLLSAGARNYAVAYEFRDGNLDALRGSFFRCALEAAGGEPLVEWPAAS